MPMSLIALLLMVFIVVGAVLMIRGIRGVPEFSEPRCARCKYDLRGMDPNARKQCPECGADLTARKAVHFGQYRTRPRTIIAGSIIAGLPILLILAMILPAIFGVRWRDMQPNSWVIERLATTSGPWDWRVVEQRYNQGRLSKEEVAATVDHLVNYIKDDRKKGNNGPLHWCDTYIEQLIADGVISDEQFAQLRDAFYGQLPRVIVRQRIKAGQRLTFQVKYGGHWDLPRVEAIKALRQVALDGQELRPSTNIGSGDPDELSRTGVWAIDGWLEIDAPVGKHELQFEVDMGLVSENSAFDMGPHGDRPGQAKRWPKPNHKWTRTVNIPLTIIGPDEDVIELFDDPALDPVKNGELGVQRIIIQPHQDKLRGTITFDRAERPQTPVSFDVVLRIEGREYPAGMVAYDTNISSGSRHKVVLDSIGPSVRTADVILRPNPDRVMSWPATTRIWGKPIEFKDVPIERDDLERSD